MGNLRVAVCDDEPMDLVQTITLIQQYDTGKCFDIFSNAYRLNAASHNIMRKSGLLDR